MFHRCIAKQSIFGTLPSRLLSCVRSVEPRVLLLRAVAFLHPMMDAL